MGKKVSAVLFLIFLAPFIGELLTGNTPLPLFFTPVVFSMHIFLYGFGAVLVREITRHWNKGVATMLLLGLAYGIIEEGIGTRGMLDPHFYSVVAFGIENFGRYAGINVLWATGLAIVHAVFSIAIPILITEAIFNSRERWLGKTTFFVFLAVYTADVLFLHFNVNSYSPGPVEWLVLIACIGVCIGAAKLLPLPSSAPGAKVPHQALLFAYGTLGSLAFFVVHQGFHKLLPAAPAILNIIAVVALAVFISWLLLRLPPLTDRQKVSLSTGALVPLMPGAVKLTPIIPAIILVILMLA